MLKQYRVEGMTCGKCELKVQESLEAVPNVLFASVDRDEAIVQLESNEQISLKELQNALPKKYSITPSLGVRRPNNVSSKWHQLKPLFFVLAGILLASILLNAKNFQMGSFMFDFMGLFLFTFSAFKFLDYKGFPDTFSMYDPLAKKFELYAWIYPFIELIIGIAFLARFQLKWTLIATLVILGITTVGVIQNLLIKTEIQCACLGTKLKLPMTEATLIENLLMIGMGVMAFVLFL